MLDKIRLLGRQAVEAGQGGNLKSMERFQSELFKEMVYFINWISELRDGEKYRI